MENNIYMNKAHAVFALNEKKIQEKKKGEIAHLTDIEPQFL